MKDRIRDLYRLANGGATMAALPLRARDGRVAVSYGGARAGDAGGPLVKLRLLAKRFPERRVGFSLLYLLSNALYLPGAVVEAVRNSGVPVVLNQNGVFYPAWYPDGWERWNSRMAAAHAAASYVLYQSEFCRACAERFLGRRVGPSDILYNAVDTEQFTPAQDTDGRRRPFVFLLTGKIVQSTAYRLTSSIEGLAAARRGGLEVRLVVAGHVDSAVESAARALAEKFGVAGLIEFRGAYAHADAPAIYRSADAYLITKHNDPCPNVVLEALACGLPVLYSASGGIPELVGTDAGVGLTVPATFEDTPAPDGLAIAKGMEKVVAGRHAMGRAARERAIAHFSLNLWLERHDELFASLVGKSADA